tara:strand:+ start:123 stop:1292 length:1170 start_codon:yes stop_codon:yes gene_type:complete
MKICVIGMGYVGLSNAVLLSTKHAVVCNDINESKLESINRRVSPIKDSYISKYFKNKKLNLNITHKIDKSILKSDFIMLCTSTNYNPKKNSFDTSSIDSLLKNLNIMRCSSVIVIKSTIPIGYVEKLNKKYKKLKIYFSPEFLREGKALYDNLYPSRIIIGSKDSNSKKYVNMIKKCCLKKNIKTFFMGSTEAETVKLFSNNYLATRVAFFNELDSYAIHAKLDTKSIIDGVSTDPRIGTFYNNPSFGFGGYCLPKDTKQLSSSLRKVNCLLIPSLSKSNDLRKKTISDDILRLNVKNIGIYNLSMKKDSDNFRESSIIDIIKILRKFGKNIFIYEPLITDKKKIFGCEIINNFDVFEKKVNLIVTNRMSNELDKVSTKIYTRDVYGEN